MANETTSERAASAPLQIVVKPQLDQMHVTLMGELDLATAPLLADRLRDMDPDCDVVIDIALLTFMDSTGLGIFIAEHKRPQANGHKLTICAPTPNVRRIFDITGVDKVLSIDPASDDDGPSIRTRFGGPAGG